jgi:hypothetical protein
MFRFTIRDLFWLMVVIGFCLHAWTERFTRDVAWRRRVDEEILQCVQAQERARKADARAKFADERAGRYARAAGQRQLERIWARHYEQAAEERAIPAAAEPTHDTPASGPSSPFVGSAE